jgi:hypothetical protein
MSAVSGLTGERDPGHRGSVQSRPDLLEAIRSNTARVRLNVVFEERFWADLAQGSPRSRASHNPKGLKPR